MADFSWIVASDSICVVAKSSQWKDGEEERFLKDPHSVLQLETTDGLGVALFTDIDLAERYIRDGNLAGYEAALLGDFVDIVHFLKAMLDQQVECFALDPTYGHYHSRLAPIESFIRNLQQAVEELPDQDSESGDS